MLKGMGGKHGVIKCIGASLAAKQQIQWSIVPSELWVTASLALQALQSGDPACVGGPAAWRAQAALLAQDRAWGAALQAASDGLAFAEQHQGMGGLVDKGELRLLAAQAMLHTGQADRAVAALSALAGTQHLQHQQHRKHTCCLPVNLSVNIWSL